jgi:hypothetical protein
VWLLVLALGATVTTAQQPSPPETKPPAEAKPSSESQTHVERLFEQAPFDLIIDRTKTVNKVMPLALPGRHLPKDPKPGDKLITRSFENPDRDFEISWRNVVEVKLFEQMVLAEADEHVAAGRFDEAYDYFVYLRSEHPNLAGLKEAWHKYLLADARAALKDGRAALALAMLNELHASDANFPGLEDTLGNATDQLVEPYVARNDIKSARSLLDSLAQKYPKDAIVTKWQERLTTEAADRLAAAKQAVAGGKLAEARSFANQAVARQPSLSGAKELVADLERRYPIAVVGVSSQPTPSRAISSSSQSIIDFGLRRQERLLHRQLLEFSGAGPEGGDYICPIGTAERENLGKRLVFRLKPGVRLNTVSTVSGYWLAQRLAALADASRASGNLDWPELLQGIDVRDVYEVDIDLRRSHLRPEALLTAPLDSSTSSAALAPFRHAGNSTEFSAERYVLSEGYFAARSAQPKEVMERSYKDRKTALAALKRGDLDLVDRVNPWEVNWFRARDDFAVGRYGIPSVHCLVPNTSRPFPGHRAFRRAVEFGIDRKLILERQLLRGAKIAGCDLVSGPFTSGVGYDDPLRYAYSDTIKPRPYEPRMAMTLAAVALHDVATRLKGSGEELNEVPPLVLAHPADDVARLACQAIQQHLRVIGITMRLEELPPGEVWLDSAKHDFLYAELTIAEPLVEVRRLFGPAGLLGGTNPYVNLALDQLDAAAGWKEAREKLQQIHQLVHDDVTVIPLWQLVDHFACRKPMLPAVGDRLVSLYQNVEQWQLAPQAKEKP